MSAENNSNSVLRVFTNPFCGNTDDCITGATTMGTKEERDLVCTARASRRQIGHVRVQTALHASPYHFAGWTDRAEFIMPETSSLDVTCTPAELREQPKKCTERSAGGCVSYRMQDLTWVHHNSRESAMCENDTSNPLCVRTPSQCATFAKRYDESSTEGTGDSKHAVQASVCMAHALATKANAQALSDTVEAIVNKTTTRTQEELMDVFEFCTRFCRPNVALQDITHRMAGEMAYDTVTKKMKPAWYRCAPDGPGHFCDTFMRAFCMGTLNECPKGGILEEATTTSDKAGVKAPSVMCGSSDILRKDPGCDKKNGKKTVCIRDPACEYNNTTEICYFGCSHTTESDCQNDTGCQWVQRTGGAGECRFKQRVGMSKCACMHDNPVARVESASSVMAFANKFLGCAAAVTKCTPDIYQRYEERVSECPGGCYAASSGDINIEANAGNLEVQNLRNIKQECAFNKCTAGGTESLPPDITAFTYSGKAAKDAVQLLGMSPEAVTRGDTDVPAGVTIISKTGVDTYMLNFDPNTKKLRGVRVWEDKEGSSSTNVCIPTGAPLSSNAPQTQKESTTGQKTVPGYLPAGIYRNYNARGQLDVLEKGIPAHDCIRIAKAKKWSNAGYRSDQHPNPSLAGTCFLTEGNAGAVDAFVQQGGDATDLHHTTTHFSATYTQDDTQDEEKCPNNSYTTMNTADFVTSRRICLKEATPKHGDIFEVGVSCESVAKSIKSMCSGWGATPPRLFSTGASSCLVEPMQGATECTSLYALGSVKAEVAPPLGDDGQPAQTCAAGSNAVTQRKIKDLPALPTPIVCDPDIIQDLTQEESTDTYNLGTESVRVCAALCSSQHMTFNEHVHGQTYRAPCIGFNYDRSTSTCTFFGTKNRKAGSDLCEYTGGSHNTPPAPAPKTQSSDTQSDDSLYTIMQQFQAKQKLKAEQMVMLIAGSSILLMIVLYALWRRTNRPSKFVQK